MIISLMSWYLSLLDSNEELSVKIPCQAVQVYHYISLRNNLSPELFIIFPHDSSVEKGMLIDIAQAIVYSYAFPDE